MHRHLTWRHPKHTGSRCRQSKLSFTSAVPYFAEPPTPSRTRRVLPGRSIVNLQTLARSPRDENVVFSTVGGRRRAPSRVPCASRSSEICFTFTFPCLVRVWTTPSAPRIWSSPRVATNGDSIEFIGYPEFERVGTAGLVWLLRKAKI